MRFRGLFVLLLAFVFAASTLVRAQDKAPEEGVLRFRGATPRMPVNGRQHLVVQAEIPGGRAMQVAVPNNDENRPNYNPKKDLADAIKALKPGDLIKVTLDPARPMPLLRSVDAYDIKPGEDTPNGFVFKNTYDQGSGRNKTVAVELTKFGQSIVLTIPTRKNEKGDVETDPDILAAVNLMKEGDSVWAQFSGKTLTAIDLYKDPSTGKLLKLGETEVDGHKVRSAEVDQDGKSITLLVPGKLTGKMWSADPAILRELQRLKPNTMIAYRAREDGDRLWIREIGPAPKTAAAPEGMKDKMMKN